MKSKAAGQPPSERRKAMAVAFWLWVFSCIVAWVEGVTFLRFRVGPSPLGAIQFPLAFLSHFALIHLILALILAGVAAIVPRRWMLLWLWPPLIGSLHFLVYVDGLIYELYRFHFNASLLAVLTTPGLENNLSFSPLLILKIVGMWVGFVLLVHLAVREIRSWVDRRPFPSIFVGRFAAASVLTLLAMAATEKVLYAEADIVGRRDVLVNVRVIPFYLGVTGKRLASKFGVQAEREYKLGGNFALNYPLAQPKVPPNPIAFNILWVAIEGWRYDAFSAEITPNLFAFGRRCLLGKRNYSSGNTTRFGIFGMFYGLQGFYWQPFLAERRGPVLFKILREMNYDIRTMGSASFDSPEFRLTCFADLKPDETLDHFTGKTVDRDEAMTAAFLDFLKQRDAVKPFFGFLFYESSHAYRFKKLPGFRPPLKSGHEEFVSYDRIATDPQVLAEAYLRYQNSLAYVDFLLGRVLRDLDDRGLLTNTIVMISGDHGEEFGESGHCGHNSAFDDWQVRTPLLLHYPGVQPGSIGKMTSHVDWVPTVFGLLGIRTSPAQYCQGMDIRAEGQRDYVVAASWADAALVTDKSRLVFPLTEFRASTVEAYDDRCQPLRDRGAFMAEALPRLFEVLQSTRTFKR